MQVAVAGVAEVLQPEVVVFGQLVGKDHIVGDLGDGDHHVALVQQLGLLLDALQEGGAGGPGVLQFRGGVRHQHVQRALFQQHLRGTLHQVVHLVLAVPVKGDEQVGAHLGALHLPGEDLLAQVLLGGDQDLLLKELDGLGVEVIHLELGHGGDAGGQILKGHDEAHGGLGGGDELQGQLGDDAQGALGADHQVEQAVAGAGLAHGGAEAGDLAGGQHHGHGLHIIPGGAVLHAPHAAGVGGYVAAQGGQLLAGIGGIHAPMGQGVVRQVLEEHAGLNGDREVVQVIGQDLVHLGGADDHAPADGGAAAHQAGTGAPGGDGDIVLITHLHDTGHLFGGEGVDGHLGHPGAVDGHLVPGVVGVDLFADHHPARDYLFQFRNDFRCDRIVLSHVESASLII